MEFKVSDRTIRIELRATQKSHEQRSGDRGAPTMPSVASGSSRSQSNSVEPETAPSAGTQNQPPHSDASGYSAWLRQTFPASVRCWSMRLWPTRFRLCADVLQEQSPVQSLQRLMCCSRTHAMNQLEIAESEPSHRTTISQWIAMLRARRSCPDSAKAVPTASSLKPTV